MSYKKQNYNAQLARIYYLYINSKLTLTELQNTVLICQIVIYHNICGEVITFIVNKEVLFGAGI